MHGIGSIEMVILFVVALLLLAVPIGGLIALVVVLRKNAGNAAPYSSKLAPCPDCGRPLSPLAITCPQCGRPLRA
jgi:hypothetical protein